MIKFIEYFNFSLFLIFTICYSYQIIYSVVAIIKKPKRYIANKLHKYAVVVSARNESAVIMQLIKSIKLQKYPEELVDIYVIADNCTDNTAQLAKDAGVYVFERFNETLVGKGYAIDYALKNILLSPKADEYEGYFVVDADNLLREDYIAEMNNVFDQGYRVVTGYRNSKNYDTNWLSAAYSIWFLRESKYLNNARMILGTSCAISGTGFLVHSDIIRENGGWKHHLLTEDIEFTADNVIQGETIGYCGEAILYDEQPITFKQSWDQRLRWAKGFYQVLGKYGKDLWKTIWKRHSFSCFDMLMTVSPAMFITFLGILVNAGVLIFSLFSDSSVYMISFALRSLINTLGIFYLTFLFFGFLTLITEWKNICAVKWKRIVYVFAFPIFILTYIPIALCALRKKVEWKPIVHSIDKSIEEVK